MSKLKHLTTGSTRGGVPFTQEPLLNMLRNPFYIGKVRFKNELWKKASIARQIIGPVDGAARSEKPIKARPRIELIRSIGLGRHWLKKITVDGVSVADIAADRGCEVRMVT